MQLKVPFLLVVLCSAAVTAFAAIDPPIPIPVRAQGAQRVVVGHITDLQSAFEANQFGDQLIVSTAVIDVDETLKGAPSAIVQLKLEGGTIGTLTLRVSDLPELHRGDRAVFFLDETSAATYVPHGRGLGILPLNTDDRVPGSDLTLSAIRSLVQSAAR